MNMKNRGLLLLLIIGINVFGQSKPDTILISDQNTAYLIFDGKVDLVNLGRPTDFFAKIEDNSVFIKAKGPESGISTMLVRYQEEYYYAVLKYSGNTDVFFYDKRKKNIKAPETAQSPVNTTPATDNKNFSSISDLPSDVEEKKKEDLVKYDKEQIKARLTDAMQQKQMYKTIGEYKNKIYVSVEAISNDQTHFYFKINFSNTSSVDYKIDVVNFQYIEVYSKGLFKKKQEKVNDLFPTYKPTELMIKGKETKYLGYAIPLFALNDKGRVIIKFREYNGNRNLQIEIDSKILSTSKKIN